MAKETSTTVSGSIMTFLNNLPDDKTAKFTEEINKYLAELEKTEVSLDEDTLYEILRNNNNTLIRFKAFYILFTFHHSKRNITKCKELINIPAEAFYEFPLWHYAISTSTASDLSNETDMHLAISEAEKCIQMINEKEEYDSNYAGIYHNYADIVANTLERKYSTNEGTYEKAMEYIDFAIKINPRYAKYYYTKGRLHLICKEYSEAKTLFYYAIDKEDSSKKDYSLRISLYSDALNRCNSEERLFDLERQMSQKIEDMTEAAKKMDEELAEQKKQTLELLGFFSGIISLIIVTTEMVSELRAIEAVSILIAFLGTLLVAFSYLGFMTLNRKNKLVPRIVFTIIGVGLLIFGACIVLNYR